MAYLALFSQMGTKGDIDGQPGIRAGAVAGAALYIDICHRSLTLMPKQVILEESGDALPNLP